MHRFICLILDLDGQALAQTTAASVSGVNILSWIEKLIILIVKINKLRAMQVSFRVCSINT